MQSALKQSNREGPPREIMLLHAVLLAEIIIWSLLATVEVVQENPSFSASTLQYNAACIEASEKAIEALIGVKDVSRDRSWEMFLNT